VAKPGTISATERHLRDPIFAFTLELVTGRIPGFESYKVQRAIEFQHDLQADDFPVTDALFKALKQFAASKPIFKATPEQFERSRPFAERQLRYNILSAAYGYRVATQVFNEGDPQIARAVDAMPRARELALAANKARARG
jgi:hypothetical protein